MSACKPCSTPVDLHSKLSADGPPVGDATQYRSLACTLQYLTFTRPDIAFAVQQICLYMHDPREPHLAALKRILRYLQGTMSLGLTMRRSSPTEPARCLHGCGLGWMSRYSSIDLWLCSVPRRQPGVMVFQAPAHGLPESILLLENGFFSTNCMQMGLLIATRHAGSFEALPNALV
jgi:hypothetical protein